MFKFEHSGERDWWWRSQEAQEGQEEAQGEGEVEGEGRQDSLLEDQDGWRNPEHVSEQGGG